MQWSVPDRHLTHQAQIEELLRRASDDWIHAGDVLDVARYSGPRDDDELVEQASTLVTQLLGERLVVAGEVTDRGFTPWAGDNDEAASRIVNHWRAHTSRSQPAGEHADEGLADSDFFVWFRATEAGLARVGG